MSLREGDAFNYARIMKALGRQAPAEEWISLGKRAAELGKDAFAREAFKRGGLETAEIAESQEMTSALRGCRMFSASRFPVPVQNPLCLTRTDFVFTN